MIEFTVWGMCKLWCHIEELSCGFIGYISLDGLKHLHFFLALTSLALLGLWTSSLALNSFFSGLGFEWSLIVYCCSFLLVLFASMYFFAFQYSSWISSFLSVVFCILMVSVWSMTYDTCTNSRAFLGYHGGPVWYADHHSVEVLVSSISEAWLSLQDFPLAVHKHAFALFCVLWWLCLCDPDQSVVLLCWNDYMYPFSWLGWSLSWLIQMIVFSLRGWYKRYRSVVLVK